MSLEFVQSGERLSAMGYASNEARLFRTFRDDELNFDCDFVPDSAGQLQRCTPSASLDVVFTDTACTEPASWIWPYRTEAPTGMAVSGVPSDLSAGCPGAPPKHRDAFVVGEKLQEPSSGFPEYPAYELREGRCQTASIPGKVAPALYRLKPLPEADLVAAERVSVRVSDDLRVTRLVAEDGAELTLGVTLADGTPCELQRDGECIAEPIARSASRNAGQFFSALNADCTAPAFTAPYPTSCGTPSYAVQDDGVAPARIFSVKSAPASFELDLVQPVTDAYTYACNPADAARGDTALLAPDRDITGTLPKAQRVRRGSGPLHVEWFGVGNNLLLPAQVDFGRASPGIVPTGDFVTSDGQVCEVWPAEDGTLRCAIGDVHGTPIAELSRFPEVKLEPM